MRLIDADKLIKDIELMQIFIKGLRSGKSFLADMLERYIEEVKKTINKQPTAYDIDKVVEQLEETRKVYRLAMSYAIDIVKAGGIDEN